MPDTIQRYLEPSWSAGPRQARSPQYRAAHYRLKAVQIRELANWEPLGEMRERLLDLAQQYDQLADSWANRTAVADAGAPALATLKRG